MTSPLDKVRNLLWRCSDPAVSEEEARTSAVLAAKLIRKHNIPVGETAGAPPADQGRTSYAEALIRAELATAVRQVLTLSEELTQARRVADAWRDALRRSVDSESKLQAEHAQLRKELSRLRRAGPPVERVRAALRTRPNLSTSELRAAVGGRAVRVDAAVAELVERGEVIDTVAQRGQRLDHSYAIAPATEPVPTRSRRSRARPVRTGPDNLDD